MGDNLKLSFRPDLQIMEEAGKIYLQSPVRSLVCQRVSRGLRQLMKTLTAGGGSEDFLSELAFREDGAGGVAKFYYHLQQFIERGFISYNVMMEQEILAIYTPFSGAPLFNEMLFKQKRRYRLSRFTYSRRDGQEIILESPLANGRVVLTHWLAAAVLHLLAEACTAGEIRTQFPTLPKKSLQLFLELLLSAGILEEVDDAGISPGEGDEVLQQWEFHDLLFHARSRLGLHEQPVGGTYRFRERIAPLSAVKNPMSSERIKLYRPDVEKLQEDDYPFSLVLEERKSIRNYAEKPISVEQLGEFLYRSARIKELIKANPPAGLLYEASNRPYPGGGAAYELEIYLAVNECEGLAGGLYHYDPWQHELEKLSTRTSEVEGLLKYCSTAAGLKELPPVSLHITARFQRVAWKYQSIAYSVILKDVGALYQTLYLVATAMDLAPTAIGSGPAKLLSRMAGLNYLEESAVGEFILGNKRI